MPKRIFISYRRSDTQMAAGRLRDALAARFGVASVFRDKEAIRPGYDWVDEIRSALEGDVVVLALLGPQWANSLDVEGRRRLDDPEDSNRMELETALAKKVPVIPVLVEGARLPETDTLPASLRTLTRRNAIPLRDDDWDGDFARLADALGSLGFIAAARTPATQQERQLLVHQPFWLVGIGLVAVAVVGGFFLVSSMKRATNAPAAEITPASGGGSTGPSPAPPARAEDSAPKPPPIVNIAGTWRDINYPGVVDEVSQDVETFRVTRQGVLPNGVAFESFGEGTIKGTRVSQRYTPRYQTGAVSTGQCTGTVTANGSRITGSCADTLLGTIPVSVIRQ